MKIVTGPALRAEFRSALASARDVRLAVAFWGEGAVKSLGLSQYSGRLRVVCNLRSGGCNPNEIKKLQALGANVEVRHSDALHAKLYLTDGFLSVGSSNASSNGLGAEAPEAEKLQELNCIFCDPRSVRSAGKHFDRIFDAAQTITPADMSAATAAWISLRRATKRVTVSGDLLEAMHRFPDNFFNREIYVCVYTEGRSREAETTTAAIKRSNQLGDDWDSFEGWNDLPAGSDLICFWNTGDFDGYWNMPVPRRLSQKMKNGYQLNFCSKLEGISSIQKLGKLSIWKSAVKEFMGSNSKSYGLCELGEFYKKFLVLPLSRKEAGSQ